MYGFIYIMIQFNELIFALFSVISMAVKDPRHLHQ